MKVYQITRFLNGPSFQKERGAKLSRSISQWSWSSRKQISLLKAGADHRQTRITDYWNILNNVEKLANDNKKLSLLLQQFKFDQISNETPNHISSFTNILKQIIFKVEKNIEK